MNSLTAHLVVAPSGNVIGLYDDALDLRPLGSPRIRRASHVEPDRRGNWWADLAPADGPLLGPFTTRGAALAAERDWLLARLSGTVSTAPAGE